MNRFVKAWRALMGTLEPEIRLLPNPDEWLNIYSVRWVESRAGKSGIIRRPQVEYFHTCALALSAHPDKTVGVEVAAKLDGRLFLIGEISEVELQPKPKRAKGRA